MLDVKLQLKHVAPYLPYDLKYEHKVSDNDFAIFTLEPFRLNTFDFLRCKPILRPLEDLHKIKDDLIIANDFYDKVEISLCGKGINYRGKGMLCDYYNTDQLPYNIIQVLFNYHYDVFGLIPKGLAIDINTIEHER